MLPAPEILDQVNRKCLLGIMSAKVTTIDGKDIAQYFVLAREIRDFIPIELKETDEISCILYPATLDCRRRHQPRRPPLARIRPGSPAPAIGRGRSAHAIGVP
jgi:hypothetical protein